MTDPFEEHALGEAFIMLVQFAKLLTLTDEDLAAAGIPAAGRAKLARARARLRTQAAMELLRKDPQSFLHVLCDGFDLERTLLPAMRRTGVRGVIAALLADPAVS